MGLSSFEKNVYGTIILCLLMYDRIVVTELQVPSYVLIGAVMYDFIVVATLFL